MKYVNNKMQKCNHYADNIWLTFRDQWLLVLPDTSHTLPWVQRWILVALSGSVQVEQSTFIPIIAVVLSFQFYWLIFRLRLGVFSLTGAHSQVRAHIHITYFSIFITLLFSYLDLDVTNLDKWKNNETCMYCLSLYLKPVWNLYWNLYATCMSCIILSDTWFLSSPWFCVPL